MIKCNGTSLATNHFQWSGGRGYTVVYIIIIFSLVLPVFLNLFIFTHIYRTRFLLPFSFPSIYHQLTQHVLGREANEDKERSSVIATRGYHDVTTHKLYLREKMQRPVGIKVSKRTRDIPP